MMWRRLLSLTISALLSLLAVSFLTFLLMKAVPGGPFDGDRNLAPESLRVLEEEFHLDRPWPEQYLLYLKGIFFEGSFGHSIKYSDRSVGEILRGAVPVSLELGFYALGVGILLGLGLGIVAALNHRKRLDFLATFTAIAGVSMPSFLVAALAILFLSQKLGLFPAALWDGPAHKILPALVLGLRPAALLARLTRSSLLEILPLDYVRTARAKGLPELRIVLLHVLRNAVVPLLAVLGPMAANVLSGSFVVEYVFSIPGLASEVIQAIGNRDYPLILGGTLVYASLMIGLSLLVDFAYGFFDPRMREAT